MILKAKVTPTIVCLYMKLIKFWGSVCLLKLGYSMELKRHKMYMGTLLEKYVINMSDVLSSLKTSFFYEG